MSESSPADQRTPRPERTPVSEGTMEGNVRMPQTFIGIALVGIEHCLASPDISEAIQDLIAPVPFDERLTERTKKANAQHALYHIPVVLKEYQVRQVQISGHNTILYILDQTLAHALPENYDWYDHEVSEDGVWTSEVQEQAVRKIIEALTPERVQFLRGLVDAVTGVLREPEVAAILRERKQRYRRAMDAGIKAPRDEELGKARQQANEVYARIERGVIDFVGEHVHTDEDSKMAADFSKVLFEVFERTTV